MGEYLPVLLDISEQNCLVVGGGEVAVRKVRTLLDSGGQVTVVSPSVEEEIEQLFQLGDINWHQKKFHEQDLEGQNIVFACTSAPGLNHSISELAKRAGALVNVATSEESSTIVIPSVIKRGDLILTVSTGGKYPALSKTIADSLRGQYSDDWIHYLDLLSRFRREIKHRIQDHKARRDLYYQLLNLTTPEEVRQYYEYGNIHTLYEKLRAELFR